MYVDHPELTERSWSQATQGPNEQDWLERLLQTLHEWGISPGARPSAVTMLYATVRATARPLLRTGGWTSRESPSGAGTRRQP